MYVIERDEEKCDNCGECVDSCPAGILIMEGGKVKVTDPMACEGCETCVSVCPNGAVTIREV
ncbi:MAG: 4Fe-4S dicluster domain-containing protein [Bacillota bacterium]|jgi:ferredoxin|nr:4Fe-4S binding protein [Thermoanaerobacteraceae bacterium]